jgi:hypothetical protein
MFNNSYKTLKGLMTERKVMEWCYVCFITNCDESSTVELHYSGLTGTANHPDTQKVRMIRFFFENRPQ